MKKKGYDTRFYYEIQLRLYIFLLHFYNYYKISKVANHDAKTHILGRNIGTYKTSDQTITITYNWGATILSASDREIATARGW